MRLLITGASGQLGAYLLRELRGAEFPVSAWSGTGAAPRFGFALEPVNLADTDQVAGALRRARPTTILHAAAVASVAACHRDPVHAREVNMGGSALLAELAAESGARLILVSTDLVFDGTRGWYTEGDVPAPLSVYGRTKQAAEQAVLAIPQSVVARVSLLFGPTLIGRPAFFDAQLSALRARTPIPCYTDEWRTPLALTSAARALIALAQGDFQGVIHVGGPERLTRLEMAQKLARVVGRDPGVLVPVTHAQVPSPEPRPRDASLDSRRWRELFPEQHWPAVEEALRDMMTAG